ncbi:hypothetical protein [Mycobacterium sp.]
MQTNPRVQSMFGGAVTASLLLVAAIAVLPGPTKLLAAAAILVGFVTIYPRALSCALVAHRAPVDLYVDHNGVYADDAPLALRGDIENAYIRPALQAGTSRHTNDGGALPAGYQVDLPSYPLTVELQVRHRGLVNIDPGGRSAAAEILTTLGFPVTTCAPKYRAQTNRQRTTSVLLVALFVVAYVSYYLFVSSRH